MVYAVGDCAPAVAALNSATGGNAQMRRALSGARALTRRWVAAHVRRQFNADADRLSHPAQALAVARGAAEAGLIVHEARIASESTAWAAVRATAAAGAGGGPAVGAAPERRRKRRRKEA